MRSSEYFYRKKQEAVHTRSCVHRARERQYLPGRVVMNEVFSGTTDVLASCDCMCCLKSRNFHLCQSIRFYQYNNHCFWCFDFLENDPVSNSQRSYFARTEVSALPLPGSPPILCTYTDKPISVCHVLCEPMTSITEEEECPKIRLVPVMNM